MAGHNAITALAALGAVICKGLESKANAHVRMPKLGSSRFHTSRTQRERGRGNEAKKGERRKGVENYMYKMTGSKTASQKRPGSVIRVQNPTVIT